METKNDLFTKIKEEILKRAGNAEMREGEYERVYNSKDFKELLKVVTDNFYFCCNNNVIDAPLLEKIGSEILRESNLYLNCDVHEGYAIIDSNTTFRAWGDAAVVVRGDSRVVAWGNVTVEASENATIDARDNVTIRAWGNVTVEARGNTAVEARDDATVKAWGSATVLAWGNASVIASGASALDAWDNVIAEVRDNATVMVWGNAFAKVRDNAFVSARDNAVVEVRDNAIVLEAWDNVYIISHNSIKHMLFEKAIVRYPHENLIVIASEVPNVEIL